MISPFPEFRIGRIISLFMEINVPPATFLIFTWKRIVQEAAGVIYFFLRGNEVDIYISLENHREGVIYKLCFLLLKLNHDIFLEDG